MGNLQKIMIILLLLAGSGVFLFLINKQKKKEKTFQELKDEAIVILNGLEIQGEERKKLMYAINTKRKQLERMQDPLKFLMANGLKI